MSATRLPPQLRAMQVFVEEMGRWPSRTAPYAAMPWDEPGRPTRRRERQWLDYTERELATWLANQRQHASDRRRQLLDEHLPGWGDHAAGINRTSFEDRLMALKRELANRSVSGEDGLSQPTRDWLSRQRERLPSMSERDRLALDETYPQWKQPLAVITRDEARFERRIAELADFRERTGAWPSTRSPLKAERSLAVWLRDARRFATSERRARLSEAVPAWDVPRRPGGKGRIDEVGAARRLKELRRFIADNGRAPSRNAKPGSERTLAQWVHGHLSWDVRRRGLILSILGDHYRPIDERWSSRMDELERFVETHGRLPRYRRGGGPERALYDWLIRQRRLAEGQRRGELDRRVPTWLGRAGAREAA